MGPRGPTPGARPGLLGMPKPRCEKIALRVSCAARKLRCVQMGRRACAERKRIDLRKRSRRGSHKALRVSRKWTIWVAIFHDKSADPRRFKTFMGGGFLPPGPLAAEPWSPNIFIRTLYVYWDHTLAKMDQILRRGAPLNFGPRLAPFKIANLYTYIGSMAPNQFVSKGSGGSLLHGRASSAPRQEANLYT